MKKRVVALLIALVFGLSIISPVFAQENTSSTGSTNTQTVASATYDTTAGAAYQTTTNTTYSTTYEQTYNPGSSTTTTSTSSTTYSSTYSTTSQEVIPPISNDNITLKEAEKLTKEQKKNIISLIAKINQLKLKFNKTNAEVNYLRAKINNYIAAAKRYDRNFFDRELQRIINETNRLIEQLQKNLKNKKLLPSQISEYQKQLTQKLNELQVYQETYKNEKEEAVNQTVYQVKLLVDQIQPVVKDKVYQIEQINAQIKVALKDYEQAKKEKNYNKIIASLNTLIALYQQKVDRITEIKNLYSDILKKIENIIKESLKIKLPAPNKNIQKEQEKIKNNNNNTNIKIHPKIPVPRKGKKIIAD